MLLDLDALNTEEKASWVWKGSDCLYPAYDRCLISLSRGGADATVVREFDLPTKKFVANACCCVEQIVEISSPRASRLKRYSMVPNRKTIGLPTNGILNHKMPTK